MKGLVIILIIGVIIAVGLTQCGFGGFGNGGGSGKGEATIEKESEESEDIEIKTEDMIEVSIVENDYFLNNQKYELDELIAELKKLEGKIIVSVTNDNASLKAYENLLDVLEENNIQFVEKENDTE